MSYLRGGGGQSISVENLLYSESIYNTMSNSNLQILNIVLMDVIEK